MNGGVHLQEHELLGPLADAQREHLRSCAACARRLDVQAAVRSAIGSLPRTTEPSRRGLALLSLEQARSERKKARARLAATLAAVALAAIGAVVIWWSARRGPAPLPAPLVDELALDHLHYERRTEAAEVTGDAAAVSRWFGEQLGFSPHVGSVEAMSVAGGKRCRIGGKWSALVWIERAGHWLSMFSMPEHQAMARGCAPAQGVLVCGSPDPRGGARVLVGDLPEAEMLRLVDESLQ